MKLTNFSKSINSTSDFTWIREDEVTKIVDIQESLYEVHCPDADKNNGCGVVVCPGGAYTILAIDLEGTEVAKWLVHLGYTVFVLAYAIPNKRERALMDLSDLMTHITQNTEKYGINKDEIGIVGFSAGGHLSASYLLEKERVYDASKFVNPSFVVLIYPAYLNEDVAKRTNSDSISCPVFIFGTEDDPYVDSFYAYRTQLGKYNSKFKFELFSEGGHGYGLRKGNAAAELWPRMVEKWLEKNRLGNETI